jgi:drug/metabolite transporter (DMT)-like permease
MKWLLVTVIVLATTAGEVLQAIGMRRHGEIHDFRPGALGRVASTLARCRYILAAMVAMAVSFFAFMALVSMSELSFAVPVTAASYIIETLFAKYLLKEHIGRTRWTGVLLVACGVALLAFE